jgi:membrane fusion protein (multidrug efflux system)
MKKNFTIIASVLALMSLNSCGNKNEQAAPPPPGLPVVEVTAKDITGYQTYPVSIEGKINNAVRAKISGYIKQVYVDEGQTVSQGQPLFRLETNVQSQDANAAKSGINAAQASMNAAQAAVNAAQVEVDKLKPLVEKNIISNVRLETAKANLMRMQSQYEQAKASYQQAKATYQSVAANIDFSVVRSPISGVVGAINFREGSLVGPSDATPITNVSEIGEVYAYFSMNEAEYLDFLSATDGKNIREKIKNMPQVELILANGETFDEKGKVETVTGQINPQTGTIQFRVSFPNQNHLLSNGNSGTVKIPKLYKDALVIPESSTYEQQGLVYVYKVDQDTVSEKTIVVEERFDNLAIVKSGLNKGDKVVAKGVGKLKSGTKIKSIPTPLDSIVNPIKPIF